MAFFLKNQSEGEYNWERRPLLFIKNNKLCKDILNIKQLISLKQLQNF